MPPMNEFQDDEDAIDRLLRNAGFDIDDGLMQAEVNKDVNGINDVAPYDELDELLGFDNFGETFNESEKMQASEQVAGSFLNEAQDDQDYFDSLLRNAGFEADDELLQPSLEDVDTFDELGDLLDSGDDHLPEADIEAPQPPLEDEPLAMPDEPQDIPDSLEADAEEVLALDDLDALLDSGDDHLPEADIEAPQPLLEDEPLAMPDKRQDDLMNASFFADEALVRSRAEDVTALDELDELDEFSGTGEGTEAIMDAEIDESQHASENAPFILPDESQNEQDDLDRLLMNADFDTGALDELDDFSVMTDTNEAEPFQVVEIDDSGQTKTDSSVVVTDQVDDLFNLDDDFDELGIIQNNGVDASLLAATDLVAPDDEQQAVIESYNNLGNDEDSIDSPHFDAGAMLATENKDEFDDDVDLSKMDDLYQMDDVGDDFSSQIEDIELAGTKKLLNEDDQIDNLLLPDFDITADYEAFDLGGDTGIEEDDSIDIFGDTVFLNENEAPTAATETTGAAKTAVEDLENVSLSPFEFEKEDIKEQLEAAENKVKRTKLFSYVALGLSVVALSGAAGLGVMTYSAKAEVSKLKQEIATLEASSVKNSVNKPDEEINAIRSSILQLNQQIDGFIAELKGNSQFPVDLLNNKVPNIAAKQDMVSKALATLQAKVGGLDGKVASEEVVEAKSPKVEAMHIPPSSAHEVAPVKTEVAQGTAKESVAHVSAPNAHEIGLSKEKVKHEIAPAKVNVTPETVPDKVKAQSEAIAVKPAVTEKPIAIEKAVIKQRSAKVTKSEGTGNWGVNLIAFKQEWFAKSKAAEFERQGIFVEVIPVQERNITMYRLRVGGFKSKAAADANAGRIKNALNLDSVWVSDH